MLFYLLHNLINNLQLTDGWKESKKNCLTFIVGATIYILLYVLAEYLQRKTGYLVFELFHKFFFYFVIIDAITMAVLYKLYWGRSILNEIIPNENSNWVFKDDDHKYVKRENLEADEIRHFNQKSKKLDELDEEIDELKDKTEELETALLYHPDGNLAKEFKTNFETHSSNLGAKVIIENIDEPSEESKDSN